MSFKESLEKGWNSVQEETKKQFENAKEAIANFKPNQLEKKIEDAEKDMLKYDELIAGLEFKEKEYIFKKEIAEQELKLAEERLAFYKKNN